MLPPYLVLDRVAAPVIGLDVPVGLSGREAGRALPDSAYECGCGVDW